MEIYTATVSYHFIMKKTLIIVRHAKSSWENEDLSDFERPLNDRGKRDAPRMAKRLKEKRVYPDMMLTSPAQRALATCEIIAEGLGFAKNKIVREKSLYHASASQILQTLQQLRDRDEEEVVMIFGHNPGLTEFANELLHENIDNIPTCGVVGCRLDIDEWKKMKWGCGAMDYFDFPKKK
jgi:phosphohistidine phosphatase